MAEDGLKPLHLLQIVPYFYPAWAYGGIPRLAYGLSRGLIRLGHRVTVITTDAFDATHRLPDRQRVREHEGMRILTLPNLSNRLAYHHQGFLPLGLLRTLEEMKAEKPDLIHLHGHRHLLNSGATRLAQQLEVPLVMTPHGTLPAIERKLGLKRVFDQLLGQRVVDAVNMFVAVTRAEVAQLRQAQIEAERIAVIPNGLDLGEFERLPPKGRLKARLGIEGPMTLYLGKLTPRKGVDHLIRAMALLPESLGPLVIAGNDMGVEAELRRLVESLQLGARVKFVGLVTGEARLEALADADVLAYPSSLEIFGLVPFEGLMMGAPVVVGDDCGCGELVNQARAGVTVPFANPQALAIALRGLLEDRKRAEAMVARGQQFIRANLTWERVVPKTVEVYRGLLARGIKAGRVRG